MFAVNSGGFFNLWHKDVTFLTEFFYILQNFFCFFCIMAGSVCFQEGFVTESPQDGDTWHAGVLGGLDIYVGVTDIDCLLFCPVKFFQCFKDRIRCRFSADSFSPIATGTMP